jgi:CYTH domain-containing protein
MAKEIERKFLVREEILIPILRDEKVLRMRIAQFYLVATPEVAVRLRKAEGSDEGVILAVKHGGNMISTNEHEFPVPFEAYDECLADRVGHEIAKTRHYVWHGDREWEVDVFEGELDGLIVAELECDDAADVTDLPDWVSDEVTYDSRYKNAVLALKGKPQDLPSGIADTTVAVLEALSTLDFEDPTEPSIVDASDWIAVRPKNIITIEDPPDYLIKDCVLQPFNHPEPSPERQKAFEDALSQAYSLFSAWEDVKPSTGLRSTTLNPFSSEAQHAGLTEGLMFVPGDAVFTDEPITDGSTVEGSKPIPEEGVLLHVANSGHVVDTSSVALAFSGLSKEVLDEVFGKMAASSRYIDQSQDLGVVDDDFILVGEITDEASAELMKRAAASGHRAYPDKED